MSDTGRYAEDSSFSAVERNRGFHLLSTAEARPNERFGYWRSLFSNFALEPLVTETRYHGTARACSGDEGIQFATIDCGPTGSRMREETGTVRLNLMSRGMMRCLDARGRETECLAGPTLQLIDNDRLVRADSPTGYASNFLHIPRDLVQDILGTDELDRSVICRDLPMNGLAHILRDHMLSLGSNAARMSAAHAEFAIDTTTTLAKAYLRSIRSAARPPGLDDDIVMIAAKRYIGIHLADPELTAARIAMAIGCSRSHLYEAFEAHGLAVAQYVREKRLDASRLLLRDGTMDVGEIALNCGYGDGSAFGKAFRRRFGMSPIEWRAQHLGF